MKNKYFSRFARPLAAGMLVCAVSFPALAQDMQPGLYDPTANDNSGSMAMDLLLVRPFGVLASAVGAAGFVFSLPFTLVTGSVGDTAHEWVGKPLEYTFNRPLGDFDNCGRDRHPCGQR